jgi:hypothetical protein
MKMNIATLTRAILILLLVFTISPQIVYADDEAPTSNEPPQAEENPPPEESVKEPEPGNETELSEENSPASAEADEADPPAPESTEGDDTVLSEETTVTQAEPVEEAASPKVVEILAQIPEGTQLVILDEDGQVEPLASEKAAEIVVTGDPIWCPEGVTTPQANTDGCTDSWDSFEELLDELATNTSTYTGIGTVYVAYDYASILDTFIEFNSSFLPTLGSITLQGGWDFTTQTLHASNPYSTLNNASLAIINWDGNVTIRNIIINSSDYGLEVEAAGNVDIANVTVTNTTSYDGISVDTDGDVNLSNVVSSMNANDGVSILSGGSVTITNGSFTNNSNAGAAISADGTVNIQNSDFSSNVGGEGVYIESLDAITLNAVTASGNGSSGALLINLDKNVLVTNSAFNNNAGLIPGAGGLEIASGGTVTLSSVTASNNAGDGIVVYDSPVINLTNVTATSNGWDGVYAQGDCIDVNVLNGFFTKNGFGFNEGFGIDVETGRINLAGTPLFSNNYSDSMFAEPGDCYPIPEPEEEFDVPPFHEENFNPVIRVTGIEPYFLLCKYDSITLVTQKGNQVKFEFVCDMDAVIKDISQEDAQLFQLPPGMTFVNGITIDLLDGTEIINRLAPFSNMLLSFVIPEGMENEEFTVYYFGNSQTIVINNISKVDNRILVTANFPGVYVLAKKQ